MLTQKHKTQVPELLIESSDSETEQPKKRYTCKVCKATFAHRQSLYNHKKFNRCKKTPIIQQKTDTVSIEKYNKLKTEFDKLKEEHNKLLNLATKNANTAKISDG